MATKSFYQVFLNFWQKTLSIHIIIPPLCHEIYIKQLNLNFSNFKNNKKQKKKGNLPRRTSAGMSLLNVLGRSSSFFSSAAKTIAMTNNRIGANFMILKMTRERKRKKREREEGESRPNVPLDLKRREKKKGSSYTD